MSPFCPNCESGRADVAGDHVAVGVFHGQRQGERHAVRHGGRCADDEQARAAGLTTMPVSLPAILAVTVS